MTSKLSFPVPPPDGSEVAALRLEVRAFLDEALSGMSPRERARSWSGFDAAFSRKTAERGWIGMTWPRQYGGGERSAMERYVVLEEMLAAGAPVAAHWIADRQSGPTLLRFGTEAQKRMILPRIAAGECFFCIGMSEPDSGSDLAATRTRARATPGGFIVNGTKVWTTYAHFAHYMILFCRTGDQDKRHGGTSQFLVDMTTPGVNVRPILNLAGEHDFNEVTFQDVFLPDSALIGELGNGWTQVTSELALERSGPERFLSSFTLLDQMVGIVAHNPQPANLAQIGRLVAHTAVLRNLSRSVASILQHGGEAGLQAALVKDLGAELEQEIPEVARLLLAREPTIAGDDFSAVLAHLILSSPGFSLRGGTREILRGIIARGLSLR